MDNNKSAFFELIQAGLWEKDIQLARFGEIDWTNVFRLAEEQSVIGLVAAGIEHVTDITIPQKIVHPFVVSTLQLEQRNVSMNQFVSKLIECLRKENIYTLLVKGQGIAQCYERPLWRASGDVDLLLNTNSYEYAKKVLIPLAQSVEQEYTSFKHVGMMIGGFEVELHGTLRSRLSGNVDKMIDEVQNDVFYGGSVRSWMNGKTTLFLPAPDNDVIFVFTHILHHFFFEGIGLRQICDWCRLLWTYKDTINKKLLERRLIKMGLMTEWKAFAAYAVVWLGMPIGAMPLYSAEAKWRIKAEHINDFVLEVGNFGHKQRRNYEGMSYLKRKYISFWGRLSDMLRHFTIFPKDSIVFFSGVLRSGLHAAVKGE